MNTKEIVEYYSNLLALQYHGKLKAESTIEAYASLIVMAQTSIQVITFDAAPVSGTFVLSYGAQVTTPLAWNASAADIQTALRLLTGLASITVTGSIAGLSLTVIFVNVISPAEILDAETNTLAVIVTVTETDLILPLAVENGFDLTGVNTAVGVQLDTLGLYVGVARTGPGFVSQITLNDTDYATLIKMGIVRNSFGSSLASIQEFINDFFPNQMLVFDFKNMRMSYLIDDSIGSPDLVQLFVTQELLPKPMAVGLALVIYASNITNFFGFRTYDLPGFNSTPFNDYASYQTNWPWLSYANAI